MFGLKEYLSKKKKEKEVTLTHNSKYGLFWMFPKSPYQPCDRVVDFSMSQPCDGYFRLNGRAVFDAWPLP